MQCPDVRLSAGAGRGPRIMERDAPSLETCLTDLHEAKQLTAVIAVEVQMRQSVIHGMYTRFSRHIILLVRTLYVGEEEA